MVDTTINLLVNRTEYTNLSGTTLTLRLAVKSDNSSPAILFRNSEKLDTTIGVCLHSSTSSDHIGGISATVYIADVTIHSADSQDIIFPIRNTHARRPLSKKIIRHCRASKYKNGPVVGMRVPLEELSLTLPTPTTQQQINNNTTQQSTTK